MTARVEQEVDEQAVELERRLKHLCEAALALRDAQFAATRINRYLEEALIAERDACRRVDEQLLVIRGIGSGCIVASPAPGGDL